MKYVILKIKIADGISKAFPYIFCEQDTHSIVADRMEKMLLSEMRKDAVVYSAGFCTIGKEGFICRRGSETLGIASELERCTEDEHLLNWMDHNQGVCHD